MLQSSDSLPHVVSKFKTLIQVSHFRFGSFYPIWDAEVPYACYVFKPQNIAAESISR